MKLQLRIVMVLVALLAGPFAGATGANPARAIVIAHRGASGYVPEHTLAAYALAMLQGADFVEPDLVMTRDGQLIARHDNVLNLTTDVAQRPEFAKRRATKTVDGASVTGWFSEDFTLAEIKTLRAIERIPAIRPGNARLDGQFTVPTLQEIIDLVKAMQPVVGREVGVYPETKHPSYFAALGLALEEPLVETLRRNGYTGKDDKVIVQSFEVGNLKKLHTMTQIRLMQLLWPVGKPYDIAASGGSLTYQQMATPAGLREIASYAAVVGPDKNHFIVPLDADGKLDITHATNFVRDAHAAGLLVHPFAFRAENEFLALNLRSSKDPTARGNVEQEIRWFLQIGIDGFFTDQVDAGLRARD